MAFRRVARRRVTRRTYGRKRRTVRKRRTMYRKKRTGYKRRSLKGGRTGGSEAAKQLAVYVNPFSVATQQPKIPDGSKNFSLGSSFRTQHVLTMDAQRTNATILLFPGVCSFGVAYVGGAEGVGASPFTNDRKDLFSFFSVAAQMGMPSPQVEGNPISADAVDFNMPDLESWRMVSAGMKISCINNSLGNDGYWQAIRLKQCQWTQFGAVEDRGIFPILDQWPAMETWANDPTFSSGRLRDLGKKSFILAQNGEHHWRDWAFSVFDLEQKSTNHRVFDDSQDMIVIRITGAAGTRLLCNGFGNYEHTWNSATQLNTYMTQTMQVSPATLQQVQNKKKTMTRKAAS